MENEEFRGEERKSIGKFLRQLRTSRGINSVNEVAVRLKLSFSTMFSAENGRVSARTLLKLAEFYNVSYDALLEEANVKKPELSHEQIPA